MRGWRPALITGASIAALILTLEIAYGAPVHDALLYLAYLCGYVVVPGWLVYRALSSRPGNGLQQLAIGWALGHALELLAFMATAALGVRWLMVWFPLLVGIPAAAVLIRGASRGHRPAACPAVTPRQLGVLAAVGAAAVAYVALAYFPIAPLPGTGGARYFQDYPWAISIAAEAKHQWPITDPNVSGEPFPYHFFAHLHLAAASQITGIELPTVFLRLWILPLIALLVLQVTVAGQVLARSIQVGLIGACLVMLVGQLQLDVRDTFQAQTPFIGVFFTFLTTSPSFLFGLVLFVPVLTVIGQRLRSKSPPGRFGDWLVLALLVIGASDAKIVVLPLLAGGLCLFAAWSRASRRPIPGALGPALAIVLAVLAALYLVQYRGHSSGLGVDVGAGFEFFQNMPAVSLVRREMEAVLPTVPGVDPLLAIISVTFGAVGLLAAVLVGTLWIFRRQGRRLSAAQAWLLSIFLAGVGAMAVLTSPANNQLYFFFTALTAGSLLAAQGIWIAWTTRPPLHGRGPRLLILGLGWLASVAILILAPEALDLFPGFEAEGERYVFLFAGLLTSLLLLYLVARAWIGPSRWPAAALVSLALILVGALDTPLQRIRPALTSTTAEEGVTMTPELHNALVWIRENSSEDAVLAVNNQVTAGGPYEFSYGAFSERSVFLGGWGYSGSFAERTPLDPTPGPGPFRNRLALNEAAFRSADPEALARLRRDFGVRYLLVDELRGSPADLAALDRAAVRVYRGPGVSVFELS